MWWQPGRSTIADSPVHELSTYSVAFRSLTSFHYLIWNHYGVSHSFHVLDFCSQVGKADFGIQVLQGRVAYVLRDFRACRLINNEPNLQISSPTCKAIDMTFEFQASFSGCKLSIRQSPFLLATPTLLDRRFFFLHVKTKRQDNEACR